MDLAVTYDDVHPLWGGDVITLGPGGGYERIVRERGGGGATTRGRLTPRQVRELAELLLDVEAWVQRPPERLAVPDEGIATLTLRCGGEHASVWELSRDPSGRLRRIRDRLIESIERGQAPRPDPA